MRHLPSRGQRFIEIDHFDPRKKKDFIQKYSNLFLSDRECNGNKSNIWPTTKQRKAEIRFLNCCEEMDYGEHIKEDPHTHELIGFSPAALFHISILDLNAPHLVKERARRHRFRSMLQSTPILLRDGVPYSDFRFVDELRALTDEMIPPIPFTNKDV